MALSTHLVHQYEIRHPEPPAPIAPPPGPRKPHTPQYILATPGFTQNIDRSGPEQVTNANANAHLTAIKQEADQRKQQYSPLPHPGDPLAFGLHHGTPTHPDQESCARRVSSIVYQTSTRTGMGFHSATISGPAIGARTPAGAKEGASQASMFNTPSSAIGNTQASAAECGNGMDYPSTFGGPAPQGTYSAFQHAGNGMGMGMGMGMNVGAAGGLMGFGGQADAMMISSYSATQIATLQSRLSKRLGPEYVTQRMGPGGSGKLSYIEGWKVINLANEVFGFNGWSSQIVSMTTDYCEPVGDPNSGRFNVGVSAIIRITLRDGVYHEDIGSGSCDNMKGRGTCLEKAKKEAVTDGVKRALKSFGNLLGNCLYDKDYAKEVAKIKVVPRPLQPKDLWRRPEYDEEFQASTDAGPSRPHPMLAGRSEANNPSENQSAMSTPAPASRLSNMGPPAPPPSGPNLQAPAARSGNAQNQAEPRAIVPQMLPTRAQPGPSKLKTETSEQEVLTAAQRRANAAGLAIERTGSVDYDASYGADDDVFAAAMDQDIAGMTEPGFEEGYLMEDFDDSALGGCEEGTGSKVGEDSGQNSAPAGGVDTNRASKTSTVSGSEMRRLAFQGQAAVKTRTAQDSNNVTDQAGSGSSDGARDSGDVPRSDRATRQQRGQGGASSVQKPSPPQPESLRGEIGAGVTTRTRQVGRFVAPGSEIVENDSGFGKPFSNGSVPTFSSAKNLKRVLATESGDGFGYPSGNHFVRPEHRQTLGELQPSRSGYADPPDPKRYRAA